MFFLQRLPKLRIIFWLTQLSIIIGLWDYLPNTLTGQSLLLLAAINGFLLAIRQFELPVFTNVALILALGHFWIGNGLVSPLVASLVIFSGISLTGLISEGFTVRQDRDVTGLLRIREFLGLIKRDDVLTWVVIALFTAQLASLAQFWPVSFLQKSVLSTVVFYLVWQAWRVIGSDRKSLVIHFVFVGLAVIVVIANIVWTTWPGLKTF